MDTANIPDQFKEVWEKIKAFEFDKPGAPYPFSQRLAKRNKWNHAYALRVLEEYRKFLYLLYAAGHMVTPSTVVDEAWHLHLIYTVSYWEKLCLGIFGRPIHHHPGDGSDEDKEKFAAIYERTLVDYTQVFGTPPKDIWGEPNPLLDWRKILGSLPVGKSVKSSLLSMFPAPPSEESD